MNVILPTHTHTHIFFSFTDGSGPFATFWVHPLQDDFNSSIWLDRTEGMFDEEEYFHHQKFQEYLWEKYYFENDMIAFNLKPYRYFNSKNEVPEFAHSLYNNPCRFMHQSNTQWEYPFYSEGTLEKWTAEKFNSTPSFDLASIIRKGDFGGLVYVAHEAFHGECQLLPFHHMRENDSNTTRICIPRLPPFCTPRISRDALGSIRLGHIYLADGKHSIVWSWQYVSCHGK